jgi:hypothetical protein
MGEPVRVGEKVNKKWPKNTLRILQIQRRMN